ncbi:TPA: DUF2213 domain-containing protein [Acinetobacter baumannii]|uniref:DUF2213 domain-containing protein n=1 Tax=Acinetobacter baumannii TaxID=470 RepID=UPI0007EB9645|nr:DUF2213 domain-containing protein [Acinetobacter baumannii]MBZ0380705.1 DUF2213 domain-containing protein [Acinetobacter baumannii]MCA4317349.1 DUF2213 domain-containing protein [Acinetobacter baumannii]MCW7536072.1 DUF2213 domain-containing protein [Acinetobacter baumannii]SBS21264.1 putative bacteriophage protein,Uncharacterized protein conserved in bacteria,Uncharacterized protein conserved in bacteria (DUF2213) [Acinetobacter baumannii]HAV2932513.1 DUF2213 domain-containing protein [Aci
MFKKKHKSKATVDRSNFYTTGQLGRTRETTPEGYLLCRDVPLARIGKLLYADGEVPVTADNSGLIIIERGEDILFDPRTIASFEGKPVTNDHPKGWVTPENWKKLSNGTAHDVRRGEDEDSDCLVADLLITDKDMIDAVMKGKVEISLGYDADYTEISVGKGIQTNIFGNHIALVKKGRCGSRCKIGDSFMPKQSKGWLESLRKAKRTIDEALEKAKSTDEEDVETEDDEEDDDGKTTDAAINRELLKALKTVQATVQTFDERLSSLEKKKTKDSQSETEDDDEEDDGKGKETEDDILEAEQAQKLSEQGIQNHTGDSLQEVLSRAEVLVPGFKMPTFDSANNGQAVLNTKRNVLKQAYATADGQKVLTPFVGATPNFDTMPAYTVDAAFIGASELIKQQNNAAGVRSGISTRDFGRAPMTPAEMNKRNREYWANKGN